MSKSKTECPTCLKPRAKDGDGFITSFIDCCHCNEILAPLEESQVRFKWCKICSKRINTDAVGSFTRWLFADTTCKCEVPELRESLDSVRELQVKEQNVEEEAEDESEELELPADEFPIERYRPFRVLGQGMSGSVFLCRDKILDMNVAIKVLHVVDHASLVSFHREAKLLSTLSHSYIINVLDFGVTETGKPYMVMPYRPGVTLSGLLEERGQLDAHAALAIVRKIASALAYAHEKGVFHRDLKPDNILIAGTNSNLEEADVYLFDFGIALAPLTLEEARASQGNTMVGTPPYMSPDQVLGRKFDARSDVYSLGCVLFELIAGHPPFQGDSVFEILEKHASAAVPSLPIIHDEMTEGADVIIRSCLEKEPQDRYQSMDELGEALDYAFGNSMLSQWSVTLGSVGSRIMSRIQARKENRTAQIVMTSALLILVASVCLFMGLRAFNQSPTEKPAKIGATSADFNNFHALEGLEEMRRNNARTNKAIYEMMQTAQKYSQSNQFGKAKKVLSEAEDLSRPGSAERAEVLFQQAKLLANLGSNDEAEAKAKEALVIYGGKYRQGRSTCVVYWLSGLLLDTKQHPKAMQYIALGDQLKKTELSIIGPKFAQHVFDGDRFVNENHLPKAKQAYEEAAKAFPPGAPPVWLGYVYMHLTSLNLLLGDDAAAVRYAKLGGPIVFDTDRIQLAGNLNTVASHYEDKGNPKYGRELKTLALRLCENGISRHSEPTISTMFQLANSCTASGDFAAARDVCKDALKRLRKRPKDQFRDEMFVKLPQRIKEEEQRLADIAAQQGLRE